MRQIDSRSLRRGTSSSTKSRMIGHASCGPGPASGWNCAERARSRGKSRPSTVPSYSETCVASRSSDGSTAKPWFCVVTSTRPEARSSTGWFAPRWPNGSLYVFIPAASASSWWPRQIPSTGTRPSRSRTAATSSTSGSGSPGPFASSTPSYCTSSSASTSCGIDRHGRARRRESREDRALGAVVDDRDADVAASEYV